jgi:hypothetical protein
MAIDLGKMASKKRERTPTAFLCSFLVAMFLVAQVAVASHHHTLDENHSKDSENASIGCSVCFTISNYPIGLDGVKEFQVKEFSTLIYVLEPISQEWLVSVLNEKKPRAPPFTFSNY